MFSFTVPTHIMVVELQIELKAEFQAKIKLPSYLAVASYIISGFASSPKLPSRTCVSPRRQGNLESAARLGHAK